MKNPLATILPAARWLATGLCALALPAGAAFIDHGNGTVTDTSTGLVWDKCALGQTWDASAPGTCAGTPTAFTWQNALQQTVQTRTTHPSHRGATDWRMPNALELESLSMLDRSNPAIDPVFDNTPFGGTNFFWTSTPFASSTSATSAWSIGFDYGDLRPRSLANSSGSVRLVRGGQQGSAFDALSSAPTLYGISASGIGPSSATLHATSSQGGIIYYVVAPQGSPAPTAVQVMAGQLHTGAWATMYGSLTAQAETAHAIGLAGPAENTAYTVFLVADNGAGAQSTVGSVNLSTPPLVAPGICGSAHNTGTTPLLTSAPAANLCGAGSTASAVTGTSATWGWSCTTAAPTACQAPRGYTVGTSAGVGGSIGAAQTVAYGGTASIAITPATGYTVDTVTGCGGSLSGGSYATGQVTADCTVSATFKAIPFQVPVTDGPLAGETISLNTAPGHGWRVAFAIPWTTAELNQLPPLPTDFIPLHDGMTVLLQDGAPGTQAQVTITYPTGAIPPGAVYYELVYDLATTTLAWRAAPYAHISGDTVTLTLQDGGADDPDGTANSQIQLMGGVAVLEPGTCGSAAGGTALLTSAPAANLCATGNASAVTGGTAAWNWSCTIAAPAACQTPRGYTVTPSAGAGGSISPNTAQTVAYGATAHITVTPAADYGVDTVTGCGGSLSGSTYTTGPVTAHCTVSATFQRPVTVPEGPQAGAVITLTPPATNGWQIAEASTQTATSMGAPLPAGVTLPHGVVRLRLEQGTAGSSATVVLTYPQALAPGARYYKYGKTRDNPTPHWYEFTGARIDGRTVTLTLRDGGAGDDDLAENGVIQDPGGVALLATAPAGAQPIPTLGEWGLLLLSALLGLLALRRWPRHGVSP